MAPFVYGNAKTVAYSYTANNDLTNLNHTFTSATSNFTYTYNNVHQRTSQTASNVANHYAPPVVASAASYTPNVVNQYTQVAGVTQTYDTNGNLTNDGTNAFTYNTENLLLTATIGGNVQTYSYDPLGRRTQKVLTGPFAGTTSFLHDGNQEIAEYDGAGALLRRYVYGPGIDEPIATIDAAGTRSYHHQDGLGSVIALSNGTTGAVTASFAHGPYGETPNATGTAYRYTGRRIDPETGLYYYRARYYSPNLGRFMQTDPIGYQGGINLYAYVGNSPTFLRDPTGRCAGQQCGNASPGIVPASMATSPPQMMTATEALSNIPSGWHDYPTSNMVCPASFNCSPQMIADQLARFQVPGQSPSMPVSDGDVRPVYIPDLNIFVGRVIVDVSSDGLTIANTTLPGHLFANGQITRTAFQGSDGSWYVNTRGTGFNIVPLMGLANQVVGPILFNGIDSNMRRNIEQYYRPTQ